MINRQAKKFFDYYLKIVATEEYQSDYQRHEQEELEVHKEYIEEKHPEWRTRTDPRRASMAHTQTCEP